MIRAESLDRAWTRVLAATIAWSCAACLIVGVDWRWRNEQAMAGRLAPGLVQAIDRAALITITSKAGGLTVWRDGPVWRLRERADRVADEERVKSSLEHLARLRVVRSLTRDPARFDAVGLGDPEGGGTGERIVVRDKANVLLADVILGSRADGGRYARASHSQASFAVEGAPVGLGRPASWLDLTLAPIARKDIAAVTVSPLNGPGYTLLRNAPDAEFALAAPFDAAAVVAPIGLSATAHALTATTAIDVAAAADVVGVPIAALTVRLFDASEISGRLIRTPTQDWILLGAEGGSSAQAQMRAAALKSHWDGWAFALDPVDTQTLAPSLDVFARVLP